MQLGVFSKTFERDTSADVFETVRSHGLTCVQLNWETVGQLDMPEELEKDLCHRVRAELAHSGVSMAAVSGTFNMIHPDVVERRLGMDRLRRLAAACGDLGTGVITLCTGTRDTHSMWRAHPDNGTPEAWNDPLDSLRKAVVFAQEHGVTLAFEPEVSNVVDSARRARQLLDEVGSDSLKVVMDGANVFHSGELPRMAEILEEAFELIGADVVLAHAKDLDRDGEAGQLAAGTGLLDYGLYLQLLNSLEPDIPLILHGLTEDQVAASAAFLRSRLAA